MAEETTFTSLEGLEGDLESVTCQGDACDDIKWISRNYPNQNIMKSCKITNDGSERASVYIEWGNVVGGCGVLTDTTLDPGQSYTANFTANQMILGYCKYKAFYV